MEAVKAVFRSWDNPRANVYRRMNEIPYDWGTAVNVQCMAFGNSGNRSGTGVAFTRNPATDVYKRQSRSRCPRGPCTGSINPAGSRARTGCRPFRTGFSDNP